jgi:hypothetical protein
METFQSLLSRYAGLSFEKQYALTDYLGSHNWLMSPEKDSISFGPGKVFPAQVLGSESQSTYTWLWAWANSASGLSQEVIQDSIRLWELGRQAGIQELVQPEVELGAISGHHFALIAVGVCGAAAYYRGAYDGGAVYVLLYDPERKIVPDDSMIRMSTVYLDLIRQIQLEHRPAFRYYAQAKGLNISEAGNVIVCGKDNRDVFRATFDSKGRLAQLESTLTPGSQP